MPQDKSEFEGLQEKEQGKFNMAIATLERLGDILIEISKTGADFRIPRSIGQVRKVSLVKSFFIQSTPLLDETFVNEIKEKVLNLKPILLPVKSTQPFDVTRIKGYEYVNSFDLDDALDNILIEIQSELQKKGYFMPPKEEGGLF